MTKHIVSSLFTLDKVSFLEELFLRGCVLEFDRSSNIHREEYSYLENDVQRNEFS